jgi:hypothetical protein
LLFFYYGAGLTAAAGGRRVTRPSKAFDFVADFLRGAQEKSTGRLGFLRLELSRSGMTGRQRDDVGRPKIYLAQPNRFDYDEACPRSVTSLLAPESRSPRSQSRSQDLDL